MSEYFKNIKDSFKTLSGGLKLTLTYLKDATTSRKPIGVADENYFEADKGIFTLQYPHESFPVPDNGRYRLHNEIDDCIVCDKCAKICPVDCIDIEPIKSTEVIGETSDGTPKRLYAAKFDIDMSKCCFCGLCTTVCPTECLTMTKAYDFSEFDVKDHNYSFAEMSLVEIAQKRQEAEQAEKKKEAEKFRLVNVTKHAVENKSGESLIKGIEDGSVQLSKPVFRPKMPVVKAKSTDDEPATDAKPKPVFRPKPMIKKAGDVENKTTHSPKPVNNQESDKSNQEEEKPKPKFRPRPIVKQKPKGDGDAPE
ncbi:MAG: formate hydrogenlyase subunit 6/NADH:ubiquinone oxidoreductase subunit I [Cyclobacteriaceae bacterium]|jgi:formate hydrogenlyase subunit 6/NADH:ubiquinone oxidoreductase subunit I